MEFRIGESRAESLNRDRRVCLLQIEVESLRERAEPALGRSIACAARPLCERGNRSHVDNGAAVLRYEHAKRRMSEADDRHHVQAMHFLEDTKIRLPECASMAESCVVDE